MSFHIPANFTREERAKACIAQLESLGVEPAVVANIRTFLWTMVDNCDYVDYEECHAEAVAVKDYVLSFISQKLPQGVDVEALLGKTMDVPPLSTWFTDRFIDLVKVIESNGLSIYLDHEKNPEQYKQDLKSAYVRMGKILEQAGVEVDPGNALPWVPKVKE